MRYKKEWKGRLKINTRGYVFWDGKELGHVYSRYRKGARTAAGMETNAVFFVTGRETEYETMTAAIESLIPKEQPCQTTTDPTATST